ncbi:MAG: hypothetical protein LH629_03025 [Ignavibacteria bacterium]|nr:hypothetical protein [Ignavibacteria bacterium]
MKFRIYLFLIILPVILFISVSLFKESGGPYYLNYYDPGYVYLVNSINLSALEPIGHSDHPGTTVQIFGAVILKLIFIGKSDKQILDTVFSDPEHYLNILNKSMVGINCLVLFILGLFIYKLTKDLYLSLIIQLTPFISSEIFYGLVIVAPENFLILSCILITGGLFYFIFKKDLEFRILALTVFFAIVCGFGSESKLNFIPVCLIPFIVLRGVKYKTIFTTGTIIIFLILFLPAISKLSLFSEWAGNLALKSGVHGQSELSQLSLSKFAENIFMIFSRDIFFTTVYLIILSGLIVSPFFKPYKADEDSLVIFEKGKKVLLAIFTGVTFQILIVAKNYMPYAQYYIIPSLMFSLTGLAVLIIISAKSFRTIKFLNSPSIYISAIICITLFSIYEISGSFKEASRFRDEAKKINSQVKEYSNRKSVIPSVGTANEDCALALCVMYGYSGKREKIYREEFSELVTSKVFHDFWKNKFFSISGDTDIGKYLLERDRIIVQLMSVTSIDMIVKLLKDDYNIDVKTWKKIMENDNQEALYEIYLK